jgi:ubiquinone/menaquinone biosynthesis C-methylase UbiE
VSERQDHYSYTFYADPDNASRFDQRRFGGPIGDLVAVEQADVLARFAGVGVVAERSRAILDVGTGTGRAALLLAGQGAQVTGVDASEQMLAIARQRAASAGTAITFLQRDAHDLQFPDRRFDTVVCLRVLMHTPRWRQCVTELCRVSDRLVILDYPSAWSAARLQSWFRRLTHRLGASNEPYRVFTRGEMSAAITAAGFRVVSVHKQFVLPIALHKVVGSPRFTRMVEALLQRLGVTAMFGSPVTLLAERA